MSQYIQNLKTEIISALEALPLESLQLLAEFVAFLRRRAGLPAPQEKVIALGGLWAGTPEITATDIAEVRREVWANFGERNL
jgi:hypothetical protein